ncbi:hypothetical protein LNO81_17980 [Klebsiella variicola subsp. variicola]|nr:hypothetical protein [Klebsiella variicola subsp. variicola]
MFMKVDIDTQDVRYAEAWQGFRGTAWQTQIDVRDFIQHNYTLTRAMSLSSPTRRQRPPPSGSR